MNSSNMINEPLNKSIDSLRIALFINVKKGSNNKRNRFPFNEKTLRSYRVYLQHVEHFEEDLNSAINRVIEGGMVRLEMPAYSLLLLPALKAARLKWHPHALLSAFQWQRMAKDSDSTGAHQVEEQASFHSRSTNNQNDIKSVSYVDLNNQQKCFCFCQWITNLMTRTLVTETQSHFWFRAPFKSRMVAIDFSQADKEDELNNEGIHKSCVMLTQGTYQAPAKSLVHTQRLFFIFTGNNQSELQQALVRLTQSLTLPSVSVLSLMADNLQTYVRSGALSPLAMVLQASSITELEREIESVFRAIPTVIASKEHYQTPAGSYFFASPLTGKGLTFVYPGVGTVFDKMFHQLHTYFPSLYKHLESEGDLRTILQSDKIYTDIELNNVSADTMAALQKEELDQPIHIRKSSADEKGMTLAEQAIAGVGSSYLLTQLLTQEFQIHPQFAMGYSMGEVSMWACLGVWENPYDMVEDTFSTALFSSMISGNLHAVREAWGLKHKGVSHQLESNHPTKHQTEMSTQNDNDDIHDDNVCWGSFLLRKPAAEINAIIDEYPRVYLAINQGDTCIISGCNESCRALIKALGTRAITSSGVSAMHTGPAMLIHQETYDFYLRPLSDFSERAFSHNEDTYSTHVKAKSNIDPTQITFISSQLEEGIHYKHNPFCGKKIAKSVADNLCHPLDFPKHVSNARRLGASLFLEVGADKQNTILINRINQSDQIGKQCDAIAINTKSGDEVSALLNAIAQLICHRVPLSIQPLQLGLATLIENQDDILDKAQSSEALLVKEQ